MSRSEPPKSRCVVWHTTHSEQHQNHIRRYIHTHPFNHQVDIVIPHCASPPRFITDLLTLANRNRTSTGTTAANSQRQHEYCVMRCDAVVLLRMVLKAAQSGHLVYACSVQQRQDATGVLSVASTIDSKQCLLNMQLDKDTYEQCGLQGTVSQFRYDRLFQSRYNVEINLLQKRGGKHSHQWLYSPGRPIYEQLVNAMQRLGEVVVLFAVYNAHRESVDARVFVDSDGSSMAPVVHLTRIQGFGEAPMVQSFKKMQWIPRFMHPETKTLSAEQDAMGALHWMGLLACGAAETFDIMSSDDSGDEGGIEERAHLDQPFQTAMQLLAFNSMQISEVEEEDEEAMRDSDSHEQHHPLLFVRLRGFIPTFYIDSIVEQLRNHMKSTGGTIDWASVLVSGMEDCPISWLHHERQFGPVSGEQDYCIILHNDTQQQCWWMNMLGQKDTYS